MSDTDDETIVYSQPAGILLTKSANAPTYQLGDVMTYTFDVKNSGWNRSLSKVSVTDTGMTGLSPLSCSPTAPAVLQPKEVMT